MFILISFVLFTACPEPGVDITDIDSLEYTVWAGETPRAGDWLTIAFQPEGKVVFSFSIDNSTNLWDYTFDKTTKKGTIDTGIPWNPAPNGFAINGDILTITNYGNHEGAPRNFQRYR